MVSCYQNASGIELLDDHHQASPDELSGSRIYWIFLHDMIVELNKISIMLYYRLPWAHGNIKDCTTLTSNKHGDECGDNAATVINNHIVVTNQKQI